jgi:hypothetical protein
MDPFTLALVNLFAVLGVLTVGAALSLAPIRVTRALNEWFAVVPAVQAGQRLRLAAIRFCGVALVVLGTTFFGRAVAFAGRVV